MIVTVQNQEVPRKKENNQQMIAGVHDQDVQLPSQKANRSWKSIHHPRLKGHHNTSNKQETTIKMTSRTRNAGHCPIIWNIYGTDWLLLHLVAACQTRELLDSCFA